MVTNLTVLNVTGLDIALLGLGLSHGVTSDVTYDKVDEQQSSKWHRQMLQVAYKLAHLGGGHNKFLRCITCWLDIRAPLTIWRHLDQYKVGVTTLSESTMHTLMKRQLDTEDFTDNTSLHSINTVNHSICRGDFVKASDDLPNGFLQRRIFCCNLQVLQEIVKQRSNHKHYYWKKLLGKLKEDLPVIYQPLVFPKEETVSDSRD